MLSPKPEGAPAIRPRFEFYRERGDSTSGEETPELAPDAEVRILSRDSPALMEGADVDVDEDENKGEDDHVDVDEDEDDDDDAILRVSSCHCPASEPDAGQDEDVDEDGDEDEDAERSTPEPSSNDETPDETAAETVTEVSEDQETGPYKPIDKEEADDNTVKDTVRKPPTKRLRRIHPDRKTDNRKGRRVRDRGNADRRILGTRGHHSSHG